MDPRKKIWDHLSIYDFFSSEDTEADCEPGYFCLKCLPVLFYQLFLWFIYHAVNGHTESVEVLY